ncbi:hypothetical protein [Streptomyces boninensis]|uniref:hypothetical protein n=1 Tax=Streptomyces boninensis TaxID=2039455 RepID=UPI003B226DD4
MTVAALSTIDLIALYDATFFDGGFTARYEANGSLGPAGSGYAVSAAATQRTLPAEASFTSFAAAVEAMHARYPAADAIGGWIDQGQLYLDPVEIHAERATAERLGRLRKQIAIYDLGNSAEIRL